jgi:hypothetical protein
MAKALNPSISGLYPIDKIASNKATKHLIFLRYIYKLDL